MSMFLLLTACFINTSLYEERAAELADDDGDRWRPVDGDCDDGDADRHPENPERCDGQDQDCDGEIDEGPPQDAPTWYPDLDDDGHGDASGAVVACAAPAGLVARAGDCADEDAAVNPDAEERCDGHDQDCDGEIDEGAPQDAPTWYEDRDGDGYGDASRETRACDAPAGFVDRAGDCDDGAAGVSPGAAEVCGNGVDDNCNEDITECRWEGTSLADQHVARWEGEGRWAFPVLTDPLPGDPDGLLVQSYTSIEDSGDTSHCITLVFPANADGELSESRALARLRLPNSSCGGFVGDLGDVDGDGYRDMALADPERAAVYRVKGPLRGDRDLEDSEQLVVPLGGDERLGYPVRMESSSVLLRPVLAVGYPYGDEDQVRVFRTSNSGTLTTEDYEARVRAATPGYDYGFAIAWGDEDGDGMSDLLISDPMNPARIATIHRGPLEGDLSDAEANRRLTRDPLDVMPGYFVAGGQDLDGDGREDWLISDPFRTGAEAQDGTVHRWPGTETVETSTVDLLGRWEGRYESQLLGYGIELQDLDRDGAMDVVLGSVAYGGSLAVQYGPLSDGVTEVGPVIVGPSDRLGLTAGYPTAATLADRVVVGALLLPYTGEQYEHLLFHHLQP